jgi:hypothetical protein
VSESIEALHARNCFLFAALEVWCSSDLQKPVYMHIELGNADCMIQLVVFASEEEGVVTHMSKAVISLLA